MKERGGQRDRKPEHAERRLPQDWARLIQKLHWIGLEDEAKSLEKIVRTLPPEERGIGSCETFDTD
jgi:hypothetical protein